MLPINQLLIQVFRLKLSLVAIALLSSSILTATLQYQKINQQKSLETKIKEVGKKSKFEQKTLNQTELKQLAKLVTVRIFATVGNHEIGGSGVIIGKKNNQYLVLTNNHVIDTKNVDYKIETYTGSIYNGEIMWQNDEYLMSNDLALISFKSEFEYQTIKIKNNFSPKKNETILASGFPFQDNLQQSNKIKYTVGKLNQILLKPLMGGYQLGYTNNIHSGMSGGSILNQQGELIGINGLGKYPPFGNPYIYQNGENIPENQIETMSDLSWGIPSQSINQLINLVEKEKNLDFEIKQVD